MRHAAVLLLALASCAAAESPFRDLERPPRRAPYTGLVVEWVSQDPPVRAERVGDRSEPPARTPVTYTARLRNLSDRNSEPIMVRWLVDGVVRKTAPLNGVGAGQAAAAAFTWEAEEGRHWVQVDLVGQGEWLTFATDAHTVTLAVERRTLEKYAAEFGSFARRFQDSLAALHDSWSAVRDARFAPRGVEERLRLAEVVVYERGEGEGDVPAAFWDHPDAHLFVACDQGGPRTGTWFPAHSIAHNYPGVPGYESLFSDWGEQSLWHEIAHFRGVPDLHAFVARAGDVLKTNTSGGPLEPSHLRDAFASCIMFEPRQPLRWSEYAVAVLQMKRGVTRVGDWGDPHGTFGHVWRHIPAEVRLEVLGVDGKPRPRVALEIYRPVRSGEDGRFRVAADAEPLFAGETGADGVFVLGDDPFGRRKAEASRAPWLLVLMKREGVVRARYLTVLEANLEYWKGRQTEAAFPLVWE